MLKRHGIHAFVVILVTLALHHSVCHCREDVSAIRRPGRQLRQVETETITVQSDEELQQAVLNLRRGRTILVDANRIALSETLSIDARDVIITGRSGTSTLQCPRRSSALTISSRNVTLSNLIVTGCQSDSALVVEAESDEADDSPEPLVVLDAMTFRGNNFDGFLGGGAIRIRGPQSCNTTLPTVNVTGSTFEENASSQGGGIYCSNCDLRITDTSFTSNSAQFSGGAVLAIGQCTSLEVSSSNFTSNAVVVSGGSKEIPQRNGLPIEPMKYFQFDFPENGGGALFASSVGRLEVKTSEFVSNIAPSGGAISIEVDAQRLGPADNGLSAAVSDCTFEGNQANSSLGTSTGPVEHNLGGALYLISSSEEFRAFSMTNCNFTENSARYGGAFHAVAVARNGFAVENCSFSENRAAEAGGAVLLRNTGTFDCRACTYERNTANLGGALLLTNGAMFSGAGLTGLQITGRSGAPNRYRQNSAVHGGAVMCAGCGDMTFTDARFLQNRATRSGGAVYVLDSAQTIAFSQSHFENNVAFEGGGVSLRAAASVRFHTVESVFQNVFRDNTAVVGGGLFSEGNRQQENRLLIGECLFERNHAVDIADAGYPFSEELEEATDLSTQSRFLLQNASPDSVSGNGGNQLSGCGNGGGGGICLVFDSVPEDGLGQVTLQDIVITNNSALVGGGLFASLSGQWNSQRLRNCPVLRPTTQPCRLFQFMNLELVENTAQYGAGGMFVSSPENVAVGCQREDLDDAMDLLTAWESALLSSEFCLDVAGNSVKDAGGEYGPDVASGVYSLLLVDPPVPIVNHTGGDRLLPPCGTSPGCTADREDGVRVAVKDAFDQTITGGIADSELQVLVISSSVLGEQVYSADKGIININRTRGVGVGTSSSLTFRYEGKQPIEVNLSFATRECYPGERQTETECEPCLPDQYSFDPSSTCTDCESNAKCPGRSALIPRKGYWHSSPFSPQIHECMVKKACDYENRETVLASYYSDGSTVENLIAEIEAFAAGEGSRPSINGYLQCTPGYRSALCGSCEPGYGHFAGGECVRCPTHRNSALLFVFLSALWTLAMLSIQILLTLSSTSKQIWIATAKSRGPGVGSAVPDSTPTLREVRMRSGSVRGPRHNEANERSRLSSSGPLSFQDAQGREPLVTDHIIAIEKLTEIGKIFVNYLQVSSVGLSINVTWISVMKHLLSVQTTVISVTSGSYYVPLDCSFKDNQYGGENPPDSIRAFWLRVGLPVIILFLFLAVVQLLHGLKFVERFRTNEGSLDEGAAGGSLEMVANPQIHESIGGEISEEAAGPARERQVKGRALSRGETVVANSTSSRESRTVYSIVIVLVVVYFSYITVASEFMRAVNCIAVDERQSEPPHEYDRYAIESHSRVWSEDTSFYCFEGDHRLTGVLGGFGLAFSVLIILGIFVWIRVNRNKLENAEFIARYGFIYQSYEPRGYAMSWEAVVTARKAMVAAAVIFASRLGPNLQAVSALGVLILALMAQWIAHPFKRYKGHPNVPEYSGALFEACRLSFLKTPWQRFHNRVSLNVLESASLFMSITIFYTGILLNDSNATDAGKRAMGVAAFIANVVFIVYVMFRIYAGGHLLLDMHFSYFSTSSLYDEEEFPFPNGTSIISLCHKLVSFAKYMWLHRDRVKEQSEQAFAYVPEHTWTE